MAEGEPVDGVTAPAPLAATVGADAAPAAEAAGQTSPRDAAMQATVDAVGPVVRAVAHTIVYGGFAFWYVSQILVTDYDRFLRHFPSYATFNIKYKGSPYDYLLYPYYTYKLLISGAPLVGGAIVVISASWLPHHGKPRIMQRLQYKLREFLQWQMYPRKFWSYWTGGLSMLDMILFVLFWLANMYWILWPVFNTYDTTCVPSKKTGVPLYQPCHYFMLESMSVWAGLALFWPYFLLFIVVPQSSFLQMLTGLNYHEMIRYHRWVGHGAMLITTLHTLGYYALWGLQGGRAYFWAEFSDWSKHDSLNILAGSISWFFGLILWVTSIDWVRRRWFDFFYTVHIICFIGYVLFACIHWQGTASFFAVGLMLLAVDWAYRAAAFSSLTTVAGASLSADGETADIRLLRSPRSYGCPVQHVYLLIPAISRFRWHPFTVRTETADGQLCLSIKNSGPFTHKLLSMIARKEPIIMRVSAPDEVVPHAWRDHDAVVIFAGGVGMTSAVSVISAILSERAALLRKGPGRHLRPDGSLSGIPRHVHLVWAARSSSEFFTLERIIADTLDASGGWLEVTLHCTGALAIKDEGPAHDLAISNHAFEQGDDDRAPSAPNCESYDGLAVAAKSSQGLAAAEKSSDGTWEPNRSSPSLGSTGDKQNSGAGKVPSTDGASVQSLPGTTPATGSIVDGPLTASPLFFRRLRRVQRQGGGDIFWILAHILAFFGGLFGILVSMTYSAEVSLPAEAAGTFDYEDFLGMYWKQGVLALVCMCVCAIGTPYLLLLLPLHVYRYVRDVYGSNPQAEAVSPYCIDVGPTCRVIGSSVHVLDSDIVLPIRSGRPVFTETLQRAASVPGVRTVGVFASGPETMNQAIRADAATLNRNGLGPVYFDFRKVAGFL